MASYHISSDCNDDGCSLIVAKIGRLILNSSIFTDRGATDHGSSLSRGQLNRPARSFYARRPAGSFYARGRFVRRPEAGTSHCDL